MLLRRITDRLKNNVKDRKCYNREKAEDEARWRQYMQTGEAVPREEMSRKLRSLANRAGVKAS
jgi:hypothetical protein